MSRTPTDTSVVFTGTVDAIPITEAATTSRVVVDNDAARVVIFSFDTGQELTEHTATLPVVVHLLTGAMSFLVGDERHELRPGDVVYLAPNEVHALEAREPSLLSLVMVRGGSGHTPG
jgi:quercetin dioxygenase-like cupin family protein